MFDFLRKLGKIQRMNIPYTFDNALYAFKAGTFAIIAKPDSKNHISNLKWYTCRESFQYVWRLPEGQVKDATQKIFLLQLPANYPIERMQDFFNKIEHRLNLKEHTVFHETNNVNVTAVEPAKFWLDHGLRLGLMTILLRSGCAYNGENFETALYFNEYAAQTRKAVTKFLDGYTSFALSETFQKYVGDGHWVRIFQYESSLECLIK